MKLLLDMNLSPVWVDFFRDNNIDAVHWSAIGASQADDAELMAWARENDCTLFTHDLDFSVLLASTGASGPSVLQLRSLNVTPAAMGASVLRVLSTYEDYLERGAIVSFDGASDRVRILPIHS